ncbi:hypothetical protein CMUS01_11469 [Colletotrichum musicola]|uniref:Arrestin-like N-terminal domain-containing protein n=1 Tax=Colletotrichum musicola TaxID=2175873 RepID=A0A8H6JXN5_9PEZI|nr:hypothetical protein CMUS01_11469 [Colletotrichum musicola]
MPQHKKRAGRGLSIELDDPSAPLYPGSVIRGRVVRKSLICENVNIHVRLLGRAKAKFDHPGMKGYSCNTRTRSPFWNCGDMSVSLGSDLAFIQLGDRPLSWEFELKLPLVTQSLTGPEPGLADPGHPLPASIEWEDIRISKDIEATYFRTDETLPLRVLPTPSPVAISNFKMRDHRFSGSVEGPKDCLREKTDTVHYELSVDCPSVLQFGAAVPFGVRLVLTDSLATVKHKFGKVPLNPEAYVVGAHFKILTEVHISDPTIQQGELFTWSARPDESEWVRTRPRVASDGIAVPVEFKQQLVLKEQPVDLGKAMGLRLNDDGSFEGAWGTVPAATAAAAAAVANSIPSPANDSDMVDSPPIYEAFLKTERVVTRLPHVTSLDYQLIQPSNLRVADEILRRYTSNHIAGLDRIDGRGDLKIELDDPSVAIYPGSVVRGRVVRKYEISTSVTLCVRLLGRAKAKFAIDDHGFLPRTRNSVRLRRSFWHRNDVAQKLHDGWLRIRLNDKPKSWAFALQLPHTRKSATNSSRGAAEAGFAPGNHPLPPSYSCKKKRNGKTFEGFVEYWLEAVLEEEVRVEARVPLWVYSRPSPVVISDFMFRLSSIRSMVPSDEQVLKTCSGVPYDLHVERPSILQFGAAIPFRMRLMSRYNSDDHSDTDFFKAKPPEVFLIRAEFSIRTSMYIFYPSLDDKPDLTTRSEERSWRWEARRRGARGPFVVPTGPQDKPVDVGKALGLKAGGGSCRRGSAYRVNDVKKQAGQPPPSPLDTPAKHDDAMGDVLPVGGVASSSGAENPLQLLLAAFREART